MNGFNDCIKKDAIFDGKKKFGTYIIINSNPDKGFNFGYVVFIPNEMASNTTLIIEGANTFTASEDMQSANNDIFKNATNGSLPIYFIASKMKMPILMPLFPRVRLYNKTLYTHMLSSFVLSIGKGEFKRIDEQLICMFNDAKERFSKSNITIDDKFIIDGYSASGLFANRFTLLHPEMIKLCVGGGVSGWLTLPLKELNGEKLIYPIGMGNIKEFTQEKYEQFLKVKQFYYMGLKEDNDPFASSDKDMLRPKYSDTITVEEMNQLHKFLGRDMTTTRWNATQMYYNSLGINVQFESYEEFGHMPHPATDKITELLCETQNSKKHN